MPTGSPLPVVCWADFEPAGPARHDLVQTIGTACRNPGFFVLRLDGTRTLLTSLVEHWRQFCALPDDQKMAYHHASVPAHVSGGWLPMREAPVYMSHMDENERTAADFKQQYGVSVGPKPIRWPNEALCPGFADVGNSVAALLDHTARGLLNVFEKVLGQSDGFLKHAPGYLAVSRYPGSERAECDSSLGLHEHSDATVFTMIGQSESALEVCSTGGWVSIPALEPHELAILPGDWLELWTNGDIKAVRHRVRNISRSRMSITFFQSVSGMTIGPLPTFVDAGRPARYPSVDSDIDYNGGDSGVPRWKTHGGSPSSTSPAT